MNQFKDAYGILALAAAKKMAQEEGADEMSEFFGELEKILYIANSKIIEREQCTKNY